LVLHTDPKAGQWAASYFVEASWNTPDEAREASDTDIGPLPMPRIDGSTQTLWKRER
jgi:hypothetical protein